MPRTPHVTTRDAALGAALLQARKQVPGTLSVHVVAKALGLSPSSVSRYETGQRRPSPEAVIRLLDYYAGAGAPIDDKTRGELITLAQAPENSPWVALTVPEQRRQLDTLLKFERTAEEIVDVHPLCVPGMCQTNETSRAIMARAGAADDEVELRVAVRTGRRYPLTRDSQPALYTALINEVALRRRIGGHEVVTAQLRHLLDMAGQPNVRIRVVPDDTDWHTGLNGPFKLLKFTDRQPVVFLETIVSGLFLDHVADVTPYATAVDMVLREARTDTESVEIIAHELEKVERAHR